LEEIILLTAWEYYSIRVHCGRTLPSLLDENFVTLVSHIAITFPFIEISKLETKTKYKGYNL
jgi:hypothetical protein